MTEQLPPIDIGHQQDAPAEGENPFKQFVTQDEQQPPSLVERFTDTAVAHWYSDTLTGSYAGALQADEFRLPKAEAAGAMAGDIIGAKQQGELKLTPDQEYDLRLIQANNPNIPKLTDAQIAQMRNAAYPEASTFGEKAADIAGAVVGSMGSPEAVMVPAVRAEAALAKMAPQMTALMPGLTKRMVQTGAEQFVVAGLSNPFIQSNRIAAGLQKEFDPYEMGLAPIEGFVAGAALHGLFEVAGMGAKAGANAFKDSAAARAIMAGFESRLQENFFRKLKEVEPGFQSPDDVVNMPRSMDGLFPARTPAKAPAEAAGEAVAGEVSVVPGPGEGAVSEAPAAPVAAEPPPAPPPAVEAAANASAAIRAAEGSGALAGIPKAAEAAAAAPPVAEGGPAGVFMFDPTSLKVDAKRFQFKEGGDEQGVTTALKGVTKWDRAKGNQVIVWQDKGGEFFIVDGHQRSGLARRLIESGNEQSIELPGLLYRETDGVSAEDVRAIAAVKNIAEGSGSSLDGAKVLRSRPDLMDGSLPLSAGKGKQAAALARLDDEAFRMVVNDVVSENYGAIVGERIPNDGPRQIAAIKALSKFDPRNETEAAVLVQRVAQAELEKAAEGAQGSMFGDLESADSTAGEEMKIVGRAIKELQKDKTLFQRVVANATRIEETGSNIERGAAKEVTTEAEMFARRLASDAYTPGPLREVLKAAAKDLQSGKIQIGEAVSRIRSALRGAAEADGAARAGDRGGGEQPAAGQAAGKPAGAADAAAGRVYEVAAKPGEDIPYGKAPPPPESYKTDEEWWARPDLTILREIEQDIRDGKRNATRMNAIKSMDDMRAFMEGNGWTPFKPSKKAKGGWWISPDGEGYALADIDIEGNSPQIQWARWGDHIKKPEGVKGTREGEPLPTFEPGAEGKPQAVIPGAERASDATMAQRQADAPMRGGNEPAGGMFDEANTNQGGLQFRRGSIYPPEQAQAAALAEKTDGVVKSLHQQAFDLAALIGRPLRAGRVDAGALGQYDPSSGVARVNAVSDFNTVIHELGHGIEEKMTTQGTSLLPVIGRHALELMPLDPNGTNNPLEGFAEWMIPFIKSPNGGYAHRLAPNFARDFLRHLLDHDPALYEALMKARETYATYLSAPSVERTAASIVPMEKQGWFSGLVKSYKENGIGQTIGRILADSYTSIFDRFDPMHRSVRDMARMAKELNGGTPIELNAADNPEILLRMVFNRAAQGSYHQMRYGIVPYKEALSVGPSLYDAIALATGQGPFLGRWDSKGVADFSNFLTAKRALVLWDDYAAKKLPEPPTAEKRDVWQNTHDDLLAANPNLDRAAQMVHAYTRNLLNKLLDAGIIKKELHDELIKTPFYVPMFRDLSDKPMAGNPGGGSNVEGPGLTKLVHKMRGSDRDIIDPLQSLMQQTYLAERTIRHNDLIQSLVNLARRAGSPAGYLVEEMKPKDIKQKSFDLTEAIHNAAVKNGVSKTDTAMMMTTIVNIFGKDPIEGQIFWREPTNPNGEPIVFYKEAGELKAVRFSTKNEGMALYQTIMSMPAQAQDLFTEVISAGTNVFRGGIVFHPSYFLTNLMRDQLSAFLIRPDYIPGWDAAKGMRSELTQDDYSRMAGYAGMQSAGGYVNEPTGRVDVSNINSIARRSFGQQHTGSLLAFAEITQLSESGTRNSIFAKTYEKSLANGLSPYEAMIEAAWAGTDILDFSRHGSSMEAIRRMVPFLNAHMQGIDKLRRALYEPLSRGMRGDVLTMQEQQDVSNAFVMLNKMIFVLPVFGAMWAAINSNNEIYRDADAKTKATHFVFGVGRFMDILPKPFELALPFTAGEYAYEAFVNKDPRAAGNFATAAYETIVPPNPLTSIPMINEYYQQKTGVDTFTGRPIVPEGLQKFSPDMQFNDRTSPTAIVIAKVLNEISDKMGQGKPWSPIKVEHFFGGGFGTIGREFMAAGHWFSPNGNDMPSSLDQSFILRRLIKDPTRNSDTIQRYYAHVAQKTGDYNTALEGYNDAIKRRDMTAAQQLYRGLSEDRKAFLVLNAGGDDEGESAFDADAKKTHPLTRARLAVEQLNGLAREITANRIINTDTEEDIKMTPTMRRSALDAVHQLAAMEMRNSLVITKEPGYEGRPVLDVSKQFAIIEAASPELAEEIARRYATAKVYKTDAVAKEWPTMRRTLIQSGSEADISDGVGSITDEGYEFGGERQSRKRPKRSPIAGEAVLQ